MFLIQGAKLWKNWKDRQSTTSVRWPVPEFAIEHPCFRGKYVSTIGYILYFLMIDGEYNFILANKIFSRTADNKLKFTDTITYPPSRDDRLCKKIRLYIVWQFAYKTSNNLNNFLEPLDSDRLIFQALLDTITYNCNTCSV